MTEEVRRRECGSKVRFWTRERAIAAARAYHHRFGTDSIGAYLCRWCGGWHIGHHRINERLWKKKKREDQP